MPNRPEKPNKAPLEGKIQPGKMEVDRLDPRAILSMTATLRQFDPSLVNENDPEGAATWQPLHPDAPSRDEVLTVMAKGIHEVSKLLKAHEALKTQYSELYADALAVHTLFSNLGIDVKSMEEGLQKIVGRHKQALGVIHILAEVPDFGNEETTKLFKKLVRPATEFVETMEKRMRDYNEANPIVNDTKSDGPQVDSNIVPLPPQS